MEKYFDSNNKRKAVLNAFYKKSNNFAEKYLYYNSPLTILDQSFKFASMEKVDQNLHKKFQNYNYRDGIFIYQKNQNSGIKIVVNRDLSRKEYLAKLVELICG